MEQQNLYLAQRAGGKPNIEIKLPLLPLGVDCNAFLHYTSVSITRSRIRPKLGIAQDDIVVLFVGRLCFYAKDHPVRMYLALEQAAQASNAKVHLVQAGWFEDQTEELSFCDSARVFCASVNTICVEGRKPEIRLGIWFVADIFISLVDNIQQTFGLTPIEGWRLGYLWLSLIGTVIRRLCAMKSMALEFLR